MLPHQPGVPGPTVGNQNSYVPGVAKSHVHRPGGIPYHVGGDGLPSRPVGNQNGYVPGVAKGHDHTRIVSNEQHCAHNGTVPHGAKPAEVAAAEPATQSE